MDETPILLKKLMDGCMVRHAVLANNLANVNTSGFKRQDIDFKKTLSDAIKSGDVEKLASSAPKVKVDGSAKANDSGNSVSMQTEVATMADNSLLYSLSAGILSDKFARLHKVINGR